MMKSWKNRILGVIVCVALVLGTVSVPAFADELVVVDPIENTQSEEENAITIDPAEENDGESSAVSGASGEVDTSGFAPPSGDILDVNAEWSFDEQVEVAKRMTLSTIIDPNGYDVDYYGKLIALRGGDKIDVNMMLYYESSGSLTAKIDPKKLTATISIPAGMGVSVSGNDYFDVISRDDNLEAGSTYVIRFNALPGDGAGGSGNDIKILEVTTPNDGTIPHGLEGAFHTLWKYGDEDQEVVLIEDEENPYVFTTDKFGWSGFTGSVSSTVTATEGNVPDFYIYTTMTNSFNGSSVPGRSLTKQLVFENIFEVHDDLLVTKSDLDTMVWTYGGKTLTGTNEILTYQDGSTQYAKTFKTTVTIENSALLAGTSKSDMTTLSGTGTASLRLTLKGFKVNTEKVDEANDPSKVVTLTVKALNTGVAKAYPYVVIDETGRSDIEKDGTQQYQKITRGATHTQNISYTTPAEVIVVEDDPLDTGDIVKTITQKQDSLGTTTTASGDLMYAYYGDRLTYRFTGFGNKLDHTQLQEYTITDTFDMEALYPVEIYTGRYTNGKSGETYKIRIYTKKSGQETLAYESANYNTSASSSTTLVVANLTGTGGKIDPYDVSKVEWVFNEVSPGFIPFSTATAPGMMMAVRNMGTGNPVQGDPDNKQITNTAQISFQVKDEDDVVTEYNYDNLDAEGKAKGNYFKSEHIITYYGNGVANEKGAKTVRKVNGANPTSGSVATDDILEYTIRFRNVSRKEATNPFFDDYYTGLEPYIDDTLNYGIKEQGYGDPPFVEVLKVYDENGNDVTSDRGVKLQGVYVGPIEYEDNVSGAYFYSKGKEPDIVANMWRVRFTNEKYIQPGDTIVVTYLMRVTDPANITNRFEAWGYPTETGGEQLLPFTGGENKVDPGSTVDTLKPTLSIRQQIYKEGTTTLPNGTTTAVAVGDKVDIHVTLQNSTENRPPAVNVQGFTFAWYTRYVNVFEYNIGDNIEVNVYSSLAEADGNGTPVKTVTAKLAKAPDKMNLVANQTASSSASYYQQRAALLFNEPIVLSKGQVIKFKVQSTQATENTNASYTYQYHYSHALLEEGINDYDVNTALGSTQKVTASFINDMQSYAYNYAYSNVFVSKSAKPTLQMYPPVSTSYTSPLATYGYMRNMNLNNPDIYYKRVRERTYSIGSGTSSTAFTIYPYLYNRGSTALTFEKIYVRLPKGEEFVSIYTPTTFTGKSLGIHGTGDNAQQVVELTYNSGTYTLNPGGSLYIYLQTKMSDEAAELLLDEQKQKIVAGSTSSGEFTNSTTQLAIFSSTGFEDYTTTYSFKTLTTEQDLAKWGGTDLNLDLSKGVFQESNVTAPGYYRAYYAMVGLEMDAWKEKDNVLVRNTNNDAYSPGERMAWGVNLSINNSTTVDINNYLSSLKDPAIVVKLPTDTTYTGIAEDEYDQNAKLYDSSDGYQYVIVPLNKDLTTSVSFKVTATLGGLYGNKTAEAYLVSEQFFYQSISGRGVLQKSTVITDDVLGQLGFPASENVLKNESTAKVTGKFNFNTNKSITGVSGGYIGIDRGVKANNRDQQTIDYTLALNNQSGSSGTSSLAYNNVTFIERLPEIGDQFIISEDLNRGSTTTVHLNGVPTVELHKLDDDGKSAGTDNGKLGNYTIEYAAVPTDYQFTGVDFGFDSGTSQAGWTAVADWPADKQPTAFRIRFDKELAPKYSLRVTFKADAPSEYMPKLDAVAVNTFAAAFECQSGNTKYQLTPEADYVRVVFPDIPEMVIEGTVFIEDAATADGVYDPATETYFSDFENGKVFLDLYWFGILENGQEDTGEIIKTYQLNNNNGTYRFDGIYDEGFYYVGIRGIPDGYEIFDQIKLEELQGNKFHHSNGMTDQIPYVAGTTYIRNAGIVERINGTLTLEKKLRTSLFATDSGLVGGKPQTFVFRIDYTPLGGTVPTQTFYEVLHGDESKVIVDLPQGKYTVTEVEGWAMDYVQVGETTYTKNVDTITRQTQNIEALISNTRDQKPFFHAIAEAVNSGFDRKKAN